MRSLFNRRVLNLIPVIFLIIILLKVTYSYNNLSHKEREFAKKEAEVLSSYSLAHRDYYQKLFIDKTIPLTKKTIKALPAYSNGIISQKFSQNNSLDITVRTVSDRVRNPLNIADKEEMKAIEFFKNNSDAKYYFNDKNRKYYQYASPLKIEQKCLTCHERRSEAPPFIREKYDTAYDYKLNDIRGVLSIKIPKKQVENYLYANFIEVTLFDIVLFFALYLGIIYLTKKSKLMNKLLEEEIQKKSNELKATYIVDKLTKLPNRQQLIEDIKQNSYKKTSHLALLNIDSFKDINDFYGYHSGDKILKTIAKILVNECLCEDAKIYKLPSDEFAIFSLKDIEEELFIQKIEKLIEIIHKHEFIVQNNTIYIIISCGISGKREELMITADIALQKAKARNKPLVIYNEKLNITEKILQNTKNITILKDAIEHNLIVPFYQPIYNIKNHTIEKYECLARIVQKDGTIIPPYQFMETAIKSKLYLHITKSMLNKSFDFFREKEYEFSINLSIIDIINHEMQEFIIEKLKKFPEPERIVFEILENEKLGNYESVKKFISNIKKFGCKFAIDDFGSGYSNFSHVYELNIDYIKIDASLVKDIATDDTSRIITKSIISFASNLGLKTIAEYVEDIESFEMLEEMGVDYIQGYYIGKPMPTIQMRD